MNLEEFVKKYGVDGAYTFINRLSNDQPDYNMRQDGYKLADDILALCKSFKKPCGDTKDE